MPLAFVFIVFSAQKNLSPYEHVDVYSVTDSMLSTRDNYLYIHLLIKQTLFTLIMNKINLATSLRAYRLESKRQLNFYSSINAINIY